MTTVPTPTPTPTLGKASTQAITLLSKLRECGADYDFDLPRIIFAGKQSAGKSSLIEALTGISLPRAHRTCTRCPIEVTTTNTNTATRRSRSNNPSSSNDNKNSNTMDISLRVMDGAGVLLTVHPVCSGVEMCTEDLDVAQCIQDAQDQLLELVYYDNNNDSNNNNNNNNNIKQKQKQLFTKNVVSVQISGPDCEDLALVDLPGLIQSQEEKENEVYIERVEGLVKEYMEKQNTVIVQCIASDEDVENQKIFTLARDADPEGLRTIGVLTKPDKIEKGTEDDIVAILSGKIYSLAKGFYIVRNPNKKELDSIRSSSSLMSVSAYGKGRDIESSFFQTHATGRKLYKASPERCGSTNLLRQLSAMLKIMIDEQVPEMKLIAQRLVENTKDELHDLGTKVSTSDSRKALNDTIRDFSTLSTELIRSSGDQKSLWQKIRVIFEKSRQDFYRAIPSFDVGGKLAYCDLISKQSSVNSTANNSSGYEDEPLMMTISKVDATELKRVNSPIQKLGGVSWGLQFRPGLNGTCVCVKAYDLPQGAKSMNVQYKIVPSGFAAAVTREYTDLSCSQDSSLERLITTHVGNKPLNPAHNVLIEVYVKILGFNAIQSSDMEEQLSSKAEAFSSQRKPLSITDVKDMISKSTRREINLPGPASYATSEDIIKRSVSKWTNPARACVNEIYCTLIDELIGKSNSVLSRMIPEKYPSLKSKFKQVIKDYLQSLRDDTLSRIDELLEMEMTLYTSNNIELAEMRRSYQALIRSIYSSNASIDTKISSLSPAEKTQLSMILSKLGCKQDDLGLIPSGNSLNDEALDVMANVLAYFRVKCGAFSDTIHQHVIYLLVDKFAKDSASVLIQETNAMSEQCDSIHHLFIENEGIERVRSQLESDLLRQQQCLSLITDYIRM